MVFLLNRKIFLMLLMTSSMHLLMNMMQFRSHHFTGKKLSRRKWSFGLIYKLITEKDSCMAAQHLSWSFEKYLSAQDF